MANPDGGNGCFSLALELPLTEGLRDVSERVSEGEESLWRME